MSSISLPLRAKNEADFPQLKKIDKQIIAAAVLLQLDNQSAFALYHPEYIDGTGRLNAAGKQASKMFWGYGKAKDYRQDYETTVEEFLNGRKNSNRIADTDGGGNSDKRKDRAIRKLVSDCLAAIEDNVALDPETLKDFVTMAKALGVLKDEEEQQIRPIRVLPSLCRECRYKAFVESSVLNNEAIDCCAWCKARKIAEENGYRFNDGKNLLEIPREIIDEIESKNNVSILDIINGKIEN